jgi:hypothetical protein
MNDNEIPRRYILPPLFAYILFACSFDLVQFSAVVWLFTVVRLLPTNGLLTATDGRFAHRSDGRWQFLRTITDFLTPRNSTTKTWAIIYGTVRSLLAIIPILYLGGIAYFFLAQGLLYWLCGKASARHGSKYAEALTGMICGACIYG